MKCPECKKEMNRVKTRYSKGYAAFFNCCRNQKCRLWGIMRYLYDEDNHEYEIEQNQVIKLKEKINELEERIKILKEPYEP